MLLCPTENLCFVPSFGGQWKLYDPPIRVCVTRVNASEVRNNPSVHNMREPRDLEREREGGSRTLLWLITTVFPRFHLLICDLGFVLPLIHKITSLSFSFRERVQMGTFNTNRRASLFDWCHRTRLPVLKVSLVRSDYATPRPVRIQNQGGTTPVPLYRTWRLDRSVFPVPSGVGEEHPGP